MIIIRSPREVEQIRKANVVVAEVLESLKTLVVPGVTTDELDGISEEIILSKGAVPAFKGYHGYPKTLCVSLNEEVVHGIPNQRRLKEGDIVSIDVGPTSMAISGRSDHGSRGRGRPRGQAASRGDGEGPPHRNRNGKGGKSPLRHFPCCPGLG